MQLALCEVAGGVAIFLSPMVVYLAKFSPILPLLILGLCSLLGALATFFLPETAGQELPQTLKCVSVNLIWLKLLKIATAVPLYLPLLRDGQEFGQGQGRWDCVCIKQRGQRLRFMKTRKE